MNCLGPTVAISERGGDGLLYPADPVEANLSVCRDITHFADLNARDYQLIVDQWAMDFDRRLPGAEQHFRATPQDWKDDVQFFRLGMLCWYIGEVLGIRYKEDQVDLKAVRYTNPGDLFLNGLIDTRQGTCGNMPVLYLAIAWRLGWPVDLIVAGTHALCRFADGAVSYNIECTNFAHGFRSPPNEFLQETYGISNEAIRSGSDLCPLTPRQMLGWFVGLRGRFHMDSGRTGQAVADYHSALSLFPQSERLQYDLAEAGYFVPHSRDGNDAQSWSKTFGAVSVRRPIEMVRNIRGEQR
jgi:hypothetical protein